MTPLTDEQIARVCHEANRAYQMALGEAANPPWYGASEQLKASAVDGVRYARGEITPRMSHANWVAYKQASGWTYDEIKDFERKTHPCLVPYEELPEEQRLKDELFMAIVKALT